MKNLQVKFVGPIRRPGPETILNIETSQLNTVEDLLNHLGYKPHELKSINVMANGVRLRLDTPLDGILNVELFVAIGGG